MKLRIVALSLGLLFAQAHLVGMNKLKLLSKAHVLKTSKLFNPNFKLHATQVRFFTDQSGKEQTALDEAKKSIINKKQFCFEKYHEQRDLLYKRLKFIENERKKETETSDSRYTSSFLAQEKWRMKRLKELESLFDSIIKEGCVCKWKSYPDIAEKYSFAKFSADDLIQQLDECNEYTKLDKQSMVIITFITTAIMTAAISATYFLH